MKEMHLFNAFAAIDKTEQLKDIESNVIQFAM